MHPLLAFWFGSQTRDGGSETSPPCRPLYHLLLLNWLQSRTIIVGPTLQPARHVVVIYAPTFSVTHCSAKHLSLSWLTD